MRLNNPYFSLKANRKKMNAGEMKEGRLELFRQLLEEGEKVRRINQFK